MKMSPLSAVMILISLMGINAMAVGPVGQDEIVKVGVKKEDIACVIPSEDDLVRILTGSDDVFAYIPGDIEQEEDSTQDAIMKNQTLASGIHCPVGEPIPASAPVRLRSVCPWELIDDFDSNRYPKTLQKAVCRCTNCLDPKTNQPDDKFGCSPVYYPMPVLRRTGCKDGVATFEPKFEQVAVACDCRANKMGQNRAIGIDAKPM